MPNGGARNVGTTMARRVFPSILGSMLPALDLENRDDALVTSSYAVPVPAPRAGVLVDVARPLGLQR